MQDTLRIEIWKSKPAWHAKPASARKEIFEDFARAVRPNTSHSSQAENGPFLVEKDAEDLLIWSAETNPIVEAQAVGELLCYFEPLVFVTLNSHLTIEGLVARLAV